VLTLTSKGTSATGVPYDKRHGLRQDKFATARGQSMPDRRGLPCSKISCTSKGDAIYVIGKASSLLIQVDRCGG